MTLPPAKSQTVPTAHCTRCGSPLFPGDRFCGGCGYSLTICGACGRSVMPGATACAGCGAALPSSSVRTAEGAAASAPVGLEGDPVWSTVVERLRAALTNEFEIEGELGHGGMAAVFRAHELALSRRVAIKVMAPGLLLGQGMVERFRQEAITVANLQHANIVAVHGVRTVGDLHMFVMQYVPGRSLDRVLRDQGRLSLSAVRAIMYHVGSALDYAHRRGVIHRDIKPANILLDADGDPIVTDFGIAKVAEAPGFTRIGTVVGTPAYMSPEQCMGHDVGPASDQYALGIVAYEMIAGQTPFSGSGIAMMGAHTQQEPPPLKALRADVPDQVEAAVMRMLAKKPEDRFPDLGSAIEALDAHPLASLGPVRAEMSALAAAVDAEANLAELVRTPRSPAPASQVPPTAASDRPAKTVRPGVASIALSPPADSLEVGDCIVLGAEPKTASGSRVDGARLTWESSNEDVATVDAAGVVTGKAVGATTISVSASGARAAVDVSVIAPAATTIDVQAPTDVRSGTRATLTARALDARGQPIEAVVTWRSRNPAVAEISDSGVLSARRRGVAVVVAEAAGVARAVSITIMPPPVIEVVVDNVPPALLAGSMATLRAIVRTARPADDDQERAVEWKSSDPGVATVASNGVVTARKPGTAVISATSEGVSGNATINVVNVRAESLAIVAPPSPLRLGDKVRLEATAYDASGRVVARPVTWRSSDPRVATVDASGQLVAQAEGWAILTARSDGVETHTEIIVRQQVVPVSAAGKRESRRLALYWWILLTIVAGALAVGWRFLRR